VRDLDLTSRAREGGWQMPDGWSVWADVLPDDHLGNPLIEYGTDAYTAEDGAAFDRGDWWWVFIRVTVEDADGREWGSAGIGGVEAGDMPEHGWIDPIAERPGEYSVIREHDLIAEALRDAQATLARFGQPVLADPAVNCSGL